ncbi:hypothetical protein Sfulv_04930 [Streptomyces fulvorobeus]|uniref:Uncharacterized protein n=1 Tax=Streptomyces fulvorobeus TaxID=284028 RepID=A0A7J0BZK9_9ACTN|nr:hypothetical protein Sfulv_04930 [Streptomyces fulvorobeus]
MIVWINGAFGAGKTSAAYGLIDLLPDSSVYDPELTAEALARLLPQKKLAEVTDFQELPIWRRLVVDTAAALLAELPGVLVVPMTLLRQEYRDEIFGDWPPGAFLCAMCCSPQRKRSCGHVSPGVGRPPTTSIPASAHRHGPWSTSSPIGRPSAGSPPTPTRSTPAPSPRTRRPSG